MQTLCHVVECLSDLRPSPSNGKHQRSAFVNTLHHANDKRSLRDMSDGFNAGRLLLAIVLLALASHSLTLASDVLVVKEGAKKFQSN